MLGGVHRAVLAGGVIVYQTEAAAGSPVSPTSLTGGAPGHWQASAGCNSVGRSGEFDVRAHSTRSMPSRRVRVWVVSANVPTAPDTRRHPVGCGAIGPDAWPTVNTAPGPGHRCHGPRRPPGGRDTRRRRRLLPRAAVADHLPARWPGETRLHRPGPGRPGTDGRADLESARSVLPAAVPAVYQSGRSATRVELDAARPARSPNGGRPPPARTGAVSVENRDVARTGCPSRR